MLRKVVQSIRIPTASFHVRCFGQKHDSKARRTPKSKHVVSSLHPNRITRECYLDLSSARSPYIHYGPTAKYDIIRYGFDAQRQYSPFPEGTHGFLYYHSPDWAPRLAGQLRFRITSSPDPASFSSGTDLKLHGIPWRKSLLTLSKWRNIDAMKNLLLRDDLVSNDTLMACKSAIAHPKLYSSSRLIYAFGQPFHLRFGWNFQLCVLNTSGDKESVVDVLWSLPKTNKHRPMYPNGSAICCFELSNLPEHEGTRSIVTRVLNVIEPTIRTPQDVSDIHLPKIVEGGLLMKNIAEVARYKVPEDEESIHHRFRWGMRYLKEYPEAVGSFWPSSP